MEIIFATPSRLAAAGGIPTIFSYRAVLQRHDMSIYCHSPCHSARMMAILASGGMVIPMNWKRGSAFENKDAQVSGSRSLALLKAFIEMSISLQICQHTTTTARRYQSNRVVDVRSKETTDLRDRSAEMPSCPGLRNADVVDDYLRTLFQGWNQTLKYLTQYLSDQSWRIQRNR